MRGGLGALPGAARGVVRRAVRDAATSLPRGARELVLALGSRGQPGPTLLPGPPPGPVLVVAPHPDDEVIGPGGALARHADRGDEVVVLLLTSGGATVAGGADVERRREQETRRALRRLGVAADVVPCRLPDGDLPARVEEVAALVGRHGAGARALYAPSPLDHHPDHAAATRAVAASGLPGDVLVLGYEVWAAGPVTALLDVTDVFGRKQAALAEYHIALEAVDYVRAASGLAAYRSAACGLGGRSGWR
jgi:N-acetylglucosamine malate deacetylase 1